MFEDLAKEVGLFVIQEYVPIALALSLLYPAYDNTQQRAFRPVQAWATAPVSVATSLGAPSRTRTPTRSRLPGGLKDLNTPANDFTVVNKAEVASKFLTGGTQLRPDEPDRGHLELALRDRLARHGCVRRWRHQGLSGQRLPHQAEPCQPATPT